MEKFKYLPKEKISQLPETAGVYAFFTRRSPGGGGKKGNKLLYIGKATNIRERVKNHFQPIRPSSGQATFRDSFFINKATRIGYTKTNSEIGALILEANLIKKYQPKYNVVWKDNKNYFFVAITKEDFPRVFTTHQPKLEIRNWKLEIYYIGPFVDGKALKQTLKILRKIFPFRSCNNPPAGGLPRHPCLWYQLKRCPAPCLSKSTIAKQIPNLNNKIKKECQENIKNIRKILEGKKTQVLKNLKKEMKIASKNQKFEKAAKIRDQIKSLDRVISHAKIFDWLETKNSRIGRSPYSRVWKKTNKELKKILKIKKMTGRIEAYDISNIVGQLATGSMITFINSLPDKNFYRRFKIKISGKPNDTAMLKEVLTRRFKHKEWPYPDLILIDGGRAQLNASLRVINQYKSAKSAPISVLALAKRKNELFVENQKKPILLKNLPREIFNLILQLRDEAHRFAKKYHLKLREKATIPHLSPTRFSL